MRAGDLHGRGEPIRIGVCHCTDCRQETGSAFNFYGMWSTEHFLTAGETAGYQGRRFCPACGSQLFSSDEDEIEIKLGSLDDAPTDLVPTYELWTRRREPWLPPMRAPSSSTRKTTSF